MKKIATVLVFVFALSVTAQAQIANRMQRGSKMTAEQRATIAAKRLTLALDLNKDQANKITSLYTEQAKEREVAFAKFKKERANKDSKKSRDAFGKMNTALDKKIDFNSKMKKVLTAEQYVQFRKTQKGVKYRMAKRGSQMRGKQVLGRQVKGKLVRGKQLRKHAR